MATHNNNSEAIPVEKVKARLVIMSHLSDLEYFGVDTKKVSRITNFCKYLLQKYHDTNEEVNASYEWECFINKFPRFAP